MGNDTGGYLAIFDLFKDVLNKCRARNADPDVRQTIRAFYQKMSNLNKVAKDNADKVS